MKAGTRNWYGALFGTLIGTLGGLIGLGGAEFRLPVLIGLFKLGTLEAVILKLAGSLSLVVGLPTMIVGFARYSQSDSFAVLKQEQSLLRWMVFGSILGAAIEGMMLGLVSARVLIGLLGVVLFISAIKTFQHPH